MASEVNYFREQSKRQVPMALGNTVMKIRREKVFFLLKYRRNFEFSHNKSLRVHFIRILFIPLNTSICLYTLMHESRGLGCYYIATAVCYFSLKWDRRWK